MFHPSGATPGAVALERLPVLRAVSGVRSIPAITLAKRQTFGRFVNGRSRKDMLEDLGPKRSPSPILPCQFISGRSCSISPALPAELPGGFCRNPRSFPVANSLLQANHEKLSICSPPCPASAGTDTRARSRNHRRLVGPVRHRHHRRPRLQSINR